MTRFILICVCLPLLGCGGSGEQGASAPEMPRFDADELAKGRAIWMGTCRNCHLLGVSGAPAVSDRVAWAQRLEKGREALYLSALNGIKGSDGNYRMPPRGGNERLKEEQVRHAVDYMVAAVRELRGRREE